MPDLEIVSCILEVEVTAEHAVRYRLAERTVYCPPRVSIKTFVLAVAMALCFKGSSGEAAEIVLKAKAIAEGPLIQLGDVAEIRDPDAETVVKLSQVVLSPAPVKDRPVRVDFQMIRSRLLALGFNLANLEFSGQTSVLVSSPVVTSRAEKPATVAKSLSAPRSHPTPQKQVIEAKIQQAFARQFQPVHEQQPSLRLRAQIHESDWPVLSEVPEADLRFLETELRLGGPQVLTVQWKTGEGTVRQTRVAAWLSQAPRVVVLRHPLPRGSIIQAADLAWMESDRVDGLSSLQAAIGHETLRNLKPNEPITAEDLQAVPLVRSGEIVTVRVRSPGLVVRRQFKATAQGALNDVIHLTALDDPRERVQAQITGYHEAEILLPSGASLTNVQDATGVIRFEASGTGGRR